MTLCAFHNDASLQSRSIAGLRTCLERRLVKPGPFDWSETGGSVVGCILQSNDITLWESKLGLPSWLAVTLDSLSAQQSSDSDACDFSIKLLEVIRPGANLRNAGSDVILAVLERVGDTMDSVQSLPGVTEVHALHQRASAGEAIAPSQWRAARALATSLSDALAGSNTWEYGWAQCAETAAWDPHRSPSVVFDTLRVWHNTQVTRAVADVGWTESSDAQMGALLQTLYDQYVKDSPDPELTVFDMLAKLHPADDARLLAKYEVERRVSSDTTASGTEILLTVLGEPRLAV